MTKVVHLLGPLRPSGMERMLVSAAPYFAELGVTGVVAGQRDDHPFRGELEHAGYDVRVIPAVKSLKGPRAWASLLRDAQPDVVHVHTEEAFSVVILTAKAAVPRARIVRTIHTFFDAEGWWGIKRRAQAAISDHLVEAFVALSDEMASHERTYGRDCIVIPNWVDDAFLSETGNVPNSPDVVLVGNCEPVKNHEVVLRGALAKSWTIAHVGLEDHASPDEKQLLDELGRRGLLSVRGPADPYEPLSSGRVFALPSTREGFSVALSEAVAMGMRCLVSDTRGNRWSWEYPGVSPVQGDSVADWVEATIQALQESSGPTADLQRNLARETLSPRIRAERYAELYLPRRQDPRPAHPGSR